MCDAEQTARDSGSLGPPSSVELPCFVYGVFKPGELAFGQIEPFLAEKPQQASAPGHLWIRDGLPLLQESKGHRVDGYLLRFSGADVKQAYARICGLEPKKHYRWGTVDLLEPQIRANILFGRMPRKGSVEAEQSWWSSAEDPVLTKALDVVSKVTATDAAPFESVPPHLFDWERFFRLQMAYLLLWSSIERYTALRYGPALEAMQKIARLGSDEVFARELLRAAPALRKVVDSRDPDDPFTLRADEPTKAARYYYQVRNNLSHRGKGAWSDGETVRLSLVELSAIFRRMLQDVWATEAK